ncbi:MAG: apolipoprotein N-acyltransferase [Candidatus Brocadiia bacterium]
MGFLKRHLATALLAFGSAALIWAAFPPLDCGFLAWVSLTPWLVMAGRSASRRAWLWSLLAGYALFIALLHWLRYVGPEGWVALALYCALYWPAATWLLRRLKRRGLPFALTAPVTFAAFEFIRGNFLTGFPFFFLAHTQYRCLPIVQIADLTGVYGITFLIALVNGCLADVIIEYGARTAGGGPGFARRRVLISCAVAAALVAAALGYGWSRMRALRLEPGPKVALVQGNVPQDLKDTPSLADQLKILQRHVELSKAAVGQHAALVIWSETIFPPPMNVAYDEEFIERLAARPEEDAREYAGFLTQCRKELIGAARAVDTYMLVGSTAMTYHEPVCRCNSAYFITPQGRIVGRYDKIHLVIFGEYTPLTDVLPFLRFFRPEVMGPDLTPGKLRQLFDLPAPGGEERFGVTICYEDSVADLFSKFVSDGAEFMVNISNDGWFRNSTELDEHLAVCTFRAVENRVPIARCANTGVSALIAPDGRIAQRIVLPDGRYRGVAGTLIGNLSMTKLKSFYTAHGDLFAWACVAGLAGLILAAVFREETTDDGR